MYSGPVTLRQSEIERVTEIPGIDFTALPFDVKKRVATFVLLERKDQKSHDLADLLRMNNPNVTEFQVIDDSVRREPVRG